MNAFTHVPPGFRFHPTDEELVDYYLRKKVASKRIDLDIIKDVDLYKIEPWDLQELCKIGTDEQNDWYFFSHKDKKYPTGTRTNRATKAGFWKATGRDKAIYSSSRQHSLIGMRKTLVFYKGRAPNGQKSDWIMHEYRLETNEINGTTTSQEEGWVVCRVFKKRITTTVRKYESSPGWYDDDQLSFMQQDLQSSPSPRGLVSHSLPYAFKQELELQYHDAFLQLPQLESPKVINTQSYAYDNGSAALQSSSLLTHEQRCQQLLYGSKGVDQMTDWRVLDKFVASQLQDVSNVQAEALLANTSSKQEIGQEYASTSTSSCQIDPWK